MHRHNIAHRFGFFGRWYDLQLTVKIRDACYRNLMMDPSKVIPKGFHFANQDSEDGLEKDIKFRDRWSVRPVRYFFIDFGLSYRYPPGETNILDYGRFGQDRSVPKMSVTVPYDPFKLDIYQLGNTFMELIDIRGYLLTSSNTFDKALEKVWGLGHASPVVRRYDPHQPRWTPDCCRCLTAIWSRHIASAQEIWSEATCLVAKNSS